MSHFTVLVIGKDAETQLAPFQEELKVEFVENNETWTNPKTGETTFDYDFDPKLGKRGHWCNPRAKWDWHSLGGRWTGYFKLKSGAAGEIGRPGLQTPAPDKGWADSARKGDIDFEGMRADAAQKAAARYDLILKACQGTIPKLEFTWEQLLDRKDLTIEEKREIYNHQTGFTMFGALMEQARGNTDISKEDRQSLVWVELDQYQISREAYIEAARLNAIASFAVLQGGQWYERGKMGWWACVSGEKPEGEWLQEFSNLLDSLPDDTLLSVYDCHI